jgi:hypothetical protein
MEPENPVPRFQSTVQGHPLLGKRSVDTLHGNEYATTGEAAFSAVHAMQRALNMLH